MIPLHHDPWFTFRFADDRLIPRFHLDGVEVGRRVSVFRIDPDTGERLGLMATATVDEGGWVDLQEPIIVRAGGSIGVPHRRIGQVAVDAAVQRPHRVVMALVGLHLEDGPPRLDCLQHEPSSRPIGGGGASPRCIF